VRPLRIGVDARELLGDSTGVGRYLGELLRRWAVRPDADRRHFMLYAPEPLTLALPEGSATVRVIGSGRGTWWEQTHLRTAARRDRLDLFFAPAYTAPLGTGLPLALTIHDISFVAHPEWFRAGEGLRLFLGGSAHTIGKGNEFGGAGPLGKEYGGEIGVG